MSSEAPVVTEEITVIKLECPRCGGTVFRFNVTYTTNFCTLWNSEKTGHPLITAKERSQSHEEIVCAKCNKKAPIAIESAIRETEVFLEVKALEESYTDED